MRVVFLNQFYAPAKAATSQYLTDLAEDLAGAGNEVTVLCGNRSYPEPELAGPARELRSGVSVRRAWTTSFGRASRLGRVLDYLTYLVGTSARLATMKRPDVVVSMTTPPMIAVIGLIAARLRRARAVYWVMDLYPDIAFALGVLSAGSPTGRTLRALSRHVLSRSDSVVALGHTMAGHLSRCGARALLVIHEWEDGSAIFPRPLAGHPLRRELGWEGRFVVLYSGNMGLAHEFDTILDAASLLGDDSRILFVFAAAGPRLAEVTQAVRERGLRNVEFRPLAPRVELGARLTAADLHIVTLRNEAVGLLLPAKVYGAFAAGRPAVFVGPDTCEVAGFVEQGRCGRRVGIGEAQELARILAAYAANEERCREEGRRAREMFQSMFDRPVAMDAFRRLLSRMAAEGAPRA